MKSSVKIVEVGPRDGLQNEKTVLTTENKFEFIRLLQLAGLKVIETTSFVKPPAIPQMADAVELYRMVNGQLSASNTAFPCLVPNMQGYEKAKSVGVKEIALFSATSDSFTKKNVNATVAETFTRMGPVVQAAKADGMKIRAYVSTAFGCPYEGVIPLPRLQQIVRDFFALGVNEVSVGDTTGVAIPTQVKEATKALVSEFGAEGLAMHFHDTRGMALANILVSLEQNIRIFDSSAGGLGGCPYAKGATGNVATEDVWYLCESMGLSTGIDLDKLVAASTFILGKVGKDTPSKYLRAYLNTRK